MFLFLPVLKTECLTLALSGLDCGRDEELGHVLVLTCLHRFCTRAAARSPVNVLRHPLAPRALSHLLRPRAVQSTHLPVRQHVSPGGFLSSPGDCVAWPG